MMKATICIHGITPKKKCKICVKERHKKWRQTHREKINENKRDYFRRHPDKQREMTKKYRQTHLKKCRENEEKYAQTHKKERRDAEKRLRLRDKLKVLNHYSGDPPKCACCGETKLLFLTIDHMEHVGRKKREKISSGSVFYRWLVRNNYPDGYQVLCFNCNCGRALNNGICPHSMTVPLKPNP
jgi:hypothetical protein